MSPAPLNAERTVTISRAAVHGILQGAIRSITNPKGNAKAGQAFITAFLHQLFTDIHRGYMRRSKGGPDDLGFKWKPLSRKTIAARPITGADRKQYSIPSNVTRGLLTPEQDKRWRGIFASQLKKLEAGGAPDARARAARIAWGILKSEGARTRIDALGNRKVAIGTVRRRRRGLRVLHGRRSRSDRRSLRRA